MAAMIWKTYKYIYYRLYKWNRKMWGNGDIPEYNAMLGVTLLTFINFFSVPFLIEAITGIRVLKFPKISKGIFIILFLILTLIHYFLLIYKGKFHRIEKEFKKESDDINRRKGYFVVLYVIGSIVILFASWYGIYLRNG